MGAQDARRGTTEVERVTKHTRPFGTIEGVQTRWLRTYQARKVSLPLQFPLATRSPLTIISGKTRSPSPPTNRPSTPRPQKPSKPYEHPSTSAPYTSAPYAAPPNTAYQPATYNYAPTTCATYSSSPTSPCAPHTTWDSARAARSRSLE